MNATKNIQDMFIRIDCDKAEMQSKLYKTEPKLDFLFLLSTRWAYRTNTLQRKINISSVLLASRALPLPWIFAHRCRGVFAATTILMESQGRSVCSAIQGSTINLAAASAAGSCSYSLLGASPLPRNRRASSPRPVSWVMVGMVDRRMLFPRVSTCRFPTSPRPSATPNGLHPS